MKTKSFLWKAFFLWSAVVFGQQQPEDHPVVSMDPLFETSAQKGDRVVWDFSRTRYDAYPNTTEQDLSQLKDPATVYTSQQWDLDGRTEGRLPVSRFSQDGLNLELAGNFDAVLEGKGTLVTATDTFEVDKFKWTEHYSMVLDSDTLVKYTATYFSFFDKNTGYKVWETFRKQRALKGDLNWLYYGISRCINCLGRVDAPDISLALTPNPANDQVNVSYNLLQDSEILISLVDQAGTKNELLFSGNNDAGRHSMAFPVTNYSLGFYTIWVSVSGAVYSKSLLIVK